MLPEHAPAKQRRFSIRVVLDFIATLAMVSASSVLIWSMTAGSRGAAPSNSRTIPVPNEPLSLEGAQVLGSQAANVVIIEFSDFQCPYCATFSKSILPELKVKYIDTNRVQLAFRHLPLTNIHPYAFDAAEAAECAGRQGKFWALHDRLFAAPGTLGDSHVQTAAKDIGLDLARFDSCAENEASARVRADSELAAKLQVGGTPIFFIGRKESQLTVRVEKVIEGARSARDFATVIDALLEK